MRPIKFLVVVTMMFFLCGPLRAEEVLQLSSISWNNFGNNTPNLYLNPRVYFGGEEKIPFHDDDTATEWCKHVEGKDYKRGTSNLNAFDPRDQDRFRFENGKWVRINGGHYPRYYMCYE